MRRPQALPALALVAGLLAGLPAAAEEASVSAGTRVEFEATYQASFHGEERLVEEGVVGNGIDLQRSWFSLPPLLRLSIESGAERGLALAMEAKIKGRWQNSQPPWFPAGNFPVLGQTGNPVDIESNFFSRGIVYWRGEGLTLGLGRDRVDYNGILRGGLLPSGRLPWLDSLRMRGVLGGFTLESMFASIPAAKSWDGVDVEPNDDGSGTGTLIPEKPYGFSTDPEPTAIVEAFTRFSWEFGTLRLGLIDHAMMARRNNRFSLTDFFPFFSRHQASLPQINNCMLLEFSWELLPGLRLAGQAGFDDINGNSVGVGDNGTPTIDAYVLGIAGETLLPAGRLEGRLEAGYTHWLWGNYDGRSNSQGDQNPFLRFIYRYPRYLGGGLLLPLTSPYGPGALWAAGSGSLGLERAGLRLGWDFLLLSKNSEANLIDTPVYGNTTTAAAPRILFGEFSLPCSWTFGVWEATVEPGLALLGSQVWPELRLGAALHLRSSPRLTAADPRITL